MRRHAFEPLNPLGDVIRHNVHLHYCADMYMYVCALFYNQIVHYYTFVHAVACAMRVR